VRHDEALIDQLKLRLAAPQIYSEDEHSFLRAALDMEEEVNRSKHLRTIKSPSPLLDNAESTASKDGSFNIVRSSGVVQTDVMTLVAYNFLPEMEVNKIMMEEDGVFEQRVVERANQHSAVNHWGLVFPRPLRNRDCVTQCVFQEIEDDACIIAVESTEHGAAPPQDGVVRFYIRRLFRFSPISPTTTRVIVTSTFQLGGAIPRFVSDVRCLTNWCDPNSPDR
jgi:hypothetical protein